MTRLTCGRTTDPVLNRLLSRHPHVDLRGEPVPGQLQFDAGSWPRSIQMSHPGAGLVEIEDNNPLVCADHSGCPSPIDTLARIALDPLRRAQVLVADPVLLLSFEPEAPLSIDQDCDIEIEPKELGSVICLTAMAEVTPLEDLDELDSIYDECYGRAFFVRLAEDWTLEQVQDQAHACYRLRVTPGIDSHLLTIQTMADRNGKCGAAQVIHLLNVMNGFEETLGLETNIS